jgi:hypothetical protein
MTIRDVAKRWAEQTRPHGKAGNFRYSEHSLFSYWANIGVVTEAGHALIDTTQYSSTTSGHERAGYMAAYHAGREVAEVSLPLLGDVVGRNGYSGQVSVVVRGEGREVLIEDKARGAFWLMGVAWERIPQAWAAQLPEAAGSVAEALAQLAPAGLGAGEYLRQGDIYFVPTDVPTRSLLNLWGDAEVLKRCVGVRHIAYWDGSTYPETYFPRDLLGVAPFLPRAVAAQTRTMALGEPTTWHHRPTEVRYDREGRAYARGTVRHTEHRTLSLGKVWHRIERSRAVVSLSRDNRQWSGGGGFD